MHGGSLWYLFMQIQRYMEMVRVTYMDYSFSMWDVTRTVIVLCLLAWFINKFLYLMDE